MVCPLRSSILFLLLLLAKVGPVAADTPPGAPDELRQEVRRMIAAARDRVFPSLVHIEVVVTRYADGREIRDRAQGSGTLITPQGHVLTNQHVVQGGVEFQCTLSDRRKVGADLVGQDPLTDLAVLKLRLEELGEQAEKLAVAKFGDSDSLQIGDYVMALGSPYSLSRSVTLGIVSNTERVFPPELMGSAHGEMELGPGQRTGLFTLWIQHDALINPGNSGGPLVDLFGEIVGINEMGGASIGFAIPSNLARRVADDLIQHGEVPRSWIGVSLRPIDATGLSEGVLVDSVAVDSPAARAGLETGDVIVSLDGRTVTAKFPEEVPPLSRLIAERPIGGDLQVAYRRDGSIREARIRTEKLRDDRGEERALPAWGLTAEQLTSKLARDLGVEETAGVLVTGVRNGSPAYLAQPPLAQGDIVQAIAGTPVRTLEELLAQYQRIREKKPSDLVLMAFDRRGRSYLTLIKEQSEEVAATREVPKPWIGIATQPVLGELAEHLGASGSPGYRITRVYPETSAAAAGLRVGDVVVALDGETLAPRGLEDASFLDRRVRAREIGATVALTVLRDGQARDIPVTLERNLAGPSEARRENSAELGLTVREVTFFDRDENRWSDAIQGVIIEQIEPVSTAALAGLHPSDLIQQIDGRPIRGVEGFQKILDDLANRKPKRVEIEFLRGTRTHLQFFEPSWELDPQTRER
jgi:serine protease Do